MGPSDLIVRAGDRVRAAGQIVVVGDGRWLTTSGVTPLVWPPGPVTVDPSTSIPVTGAEATDHWVTVMGDWDGATLHVTEVAPLVPADDGERGPRWTTPPCPEPPGGWPRGTNGNEVDNLTFDLGDLEETGAAVSVVMFRPGPDQVVLVVAASDPVRVQQVLGPQLPGRLCVVPSRFTRAELDVVTDYLVERMEEWTLETVSGDVDDLGRECVKAELMWVTPDLAAYAESLPAGLLTLQPSIAPLRAL